MAGRPESARREELRAKECDEGAGPQSATIRTFAYWDSPVSYGQDLATLVRLVATGRLHPEIGRLAGWEHAAATLTDLYQRRIRGNAVLTIS